MRTLEDRLLNDFQRDFPLESRPFLAVSRGLGVPETEVIRILGRLADEGKVSRVGAVLSPRSVGASTLAAISVPETQVEDAAARVSARPEVNHNYLRGHAYNLWFVVTAQDDAGLERCLHAIHRETGSRPISLPLLEEYHIDLGFDLAHGRAADRAVRTGSSRRHVLSEAQKRLLAALQGGLELVPRPFGRLAMRAGLTEEEVLDHLRAWTESGLIKRFGVVVRHHELGFRANAMCVWDVPDADAGTLGRRLASEPCVSLCYRRQRAQPHWTYNLFCMIHGRSREEVGRCIAGLRERHGLDRYAHAVLFSERRYKQRGARYVHEREHAHG